MIPPGKISDWVIVYRGCKNQKSKIPDVPSNTKTSMGSDHKVNNTYLKR